MKKTALVCGAGGFIGPHLVRRLKVRPVPEVMSQFIESLHYKMALTVIHEISVKTICVKRKA